MKTAYDHQMNIKESKICNDDSKPWYYTVTARFYQA
jgi:hypothetical protein